MANVLFVEKKLRNEKLGVMLLSAILKGDGHNVLLVQAELEDVEQVMSSFSPDYVAYSIMTGDHSYALRLNHSLKSNYSFESIFGGPHCTFFPEIVQDQDVDFVVQGAGEALILDIVRGRLEKGVHRGNIVDDVDSIPFPDRDILYKYQEYHDNPIKNVMTIRDCPYNCSYCYNHLWKEFYRDQKQKLFQRRSVDNVLQEIDMIRSRFPLEKVNFLDDNFIQKNSWITKFCKEYKKKIGLPFLVNVRANLVEERLVSTLKDAGLEMVNFALESANPQVQREILNRGDFSNDNIVKTIKLFQQYGIRIRMQNMIGLPVQDSLGDALNTLNFNLEHRVDDSWVSIFQPYPRTKLAEYCKENGFLAGDPIESCADSFFDESRIAISNKTKISRLQKWWYTIIRYNLPIELVKVLLDLPLSEDNAEQLLSMRFSMSKKHFYGLETS